MIELPPAPYILTCLGCLLAILIGAAFRLSLLMQGSAEAEVLPKSLRRWLYGISHSKKPY
jgi:hypothetical protein